MKEFEASRLSEGNSLKPSKIRIDENEVTHVIPGLFGDSNKILKYKEILSVSIDTPMIGFSKIRIESSGGNDINTSGFSKEDAITIKETIEAKLSTERNNESKSNNSNTTIANKKVTSDEIPKMYDEQLEKIIELALVDGIVTEKEREIILRKAEKLGLDIDEVEMYLENRISSLTNNSKTKEEKTENVEENTTDKFEITDGELVKRCEFWVNLTKEKKYEGVVDIFPKENTKANKYLEQAGDAITKFGEKHGDKIVKANDSIVGKTLVTVVKGVNYVVPTVLGDAISETSDVISEHGNSPKTNKPEIEEQTVKIEIDNEEICELARNYMDILRIRTVKSTELKNKYIDLTSLLEINKKKYEDSIGLFGRSFNKLF